MDREETTSERSMCRAVGREHENIAGEAEWTECRKELEGGIESERETENDREKEGDGKGKGRDAERMRNKEGSWGCGCGGQQTRPSS